MSGFTASFRFHWDPPTIQRQKKGPKGTGLAESPCPATGTASAGIPVGSSASSPSLGQRREGTHLWSLWGGLRHRDPSESSCETRKVDESDARDQGKVPEPRAGNSWESRAGAGGIGLREPDDGGKQGSLCRSEAPRFPSLALP